MLFLLYYVRNGIFEEAGFQLPEAMKEAQPQLQPEAIAAIVAAVVLALIALALAVFAYMKSSTYICFTYSNCYFHEIFAKKTWESIPVISTPQCRY